MTRDELNALLDEIEDDLERAHVAGGTTEDTRSALIAADVQKKVAKADAARSELRLSSDTPEWGRLLKISKRVLIIVFDLLDI